MSLTLNALSFPKHIFKFKPIIFQAENSVIWKLPAVNCHKNTETKWLLHSEVVTLNYQSHLLQVQTQDLYHGIGHKHTDTAGNNI